MRIFVGSYDCIDKLKTGSQQSLHSQEIGKQEAINITNRSKKKDDITVKTLAIFENDPLPIFITPAPSDVTFLP